MKDLYEGHVNLRIQTGNLSHCKLQLDTGEVVHKVNIYEKARSGLAILKNNPSFLFSMVMTFSARAKEMSYIVQEQHKQFERDFNLLINTDFTPELVNLNGPPYKKATTTQPFVTILDKALWYGIHAYDIEVMTKSDSQGDQMESLFFAWIYIMRIVQRKEFYHVKTLNWAVINNSTPLFDLLCCDSWEKFDDSFFVILSKKEKSEFEKLYKCREILQKEFQDEITTAEIIATETQIAWTKFLAILNDLSCQESNTIAHIINPSLSKREKLSVISHFNSVLYNIEKGHYIIKNENIPLVEVLEAVWRRFENAPSYCLAQDDQGNSFRVYPLLPYLVFNAQTYNYLYITFHQFRLEPKKDNAKRFAELALSCLKRNFGITESVPNVSISDIVKDFHATAMEFIDRYRTAIDNLKFDTRQHDSILPFDSSLSAIGLEAFEAHLADLVSTAQEDLSNESLLYQPRSREQTLAQLDKECQQLQQIQDEQEARQIVVSMNIIYMFCSAVRIMLTNKRAHIEFQNQKAIENYRNELLDLDSMLIQKVYSKPGSMRSYRESMGIIADTLSEQEANEEEYRNLLFSNELKDVIDELAKAIECQNTEGLLEVKRQIKAKILQCPVCEFKEQFAEWLDSISDRICSALVNNVKTKGTHFDFVKQILSAKLGAESRLLPPSTLDSLTTAELLYEEYASPDYADKGFDYSCVSALYYQSFEEAYNQLIWRKYASMLNSLSIDGKPYVDIVDEFRNKEMPTNAQGYLEKGAKNRGYYVDYKSRTNPATSVKTNCMYGSFVKLMEQVTVSSKLDKFCDYLAEITGYPNTQSMFEDSDFMKKLCDFTAAIENSKDDRNNASHGGKTIDIVQCRADKKAVLNELESVRKESLGLIQQLLYLVRNCPQ